MQGALESVNGVKKVTVSVKEKEAVVVFHGDKNILKKFNKIVVGNSVRGTIKVDSVIDIEGKKVFS